MAIAPENQEWLSNPDLTPGDMDWKTTIDLANPRWPYYVLMRCPYLDFPLEFFTIMAQIGYNLDAANFVTPDGRSLEEWNETGRPSFLKDPIEKEFYDGAWPLGFVVQMEFIRDAHDFQNCEDSQGLDKIDAFVHDMMEMQETLTNEQIIRCAKHYWGGYAWDIAWQYESSIARLERLKAVLDDLVDEFKDIMRWSLEFLMDQCIMNLISEYKIFARRLKTPSATYVQVDGEGEQLLLPALLMFLRCLLK